MSLEEAEELDGEDVEVKIWMSVNIRMVMT